MTDCLELSLELEEDLEKVRKTHPDYQIFSDLRKLISEGKQRQASYQQQAKLCEESLAMLARCINNLEALGEPFNRAKWDQRHKYIQEALALASRTPGPGAALKLAQVSHAQADQWKEIAKRTISAVDVLARLR